jgi:hypothetical protein
MASSVGKAANDALPALKVALTGAAGAANILIQSLSGAVGILAPFAGDALLAAGAIKGISLASSGLSAAQGAIGKVTSAYGTMADRASFAAGTITQKLGTALGKDLNTAAGAGATAMTAARGAFTLLGGAGVVAGGALLALGYAHQQAAQHAAENTAASKDLYDTLRRGGQAADEAKARIDALSQGLQSYASQQGPAAGAAQRMTAALDAGKEASRRAYNALSEQDKATVNVTAAQNIFTKAVHDFGSGSQEAVAAQAGYQQALRDQKVLQDALATATANTTKTLADYTNAILYAAGSDTALASQEIAVRQGSLSLASAQTVAADAIAKHGKNSTEAKTATLALQQAETTLKGQILGAAEAARQAAIAHDKSGDAEIAAAAGAEAERTELIRLAAGLAPNSPLRRRLQELINQLNAIPRAVNINVVTKYSQQGIQVGLVGSGRTARAAGGPVRAGQPYVVGEKRPELFVPSTNGTIVPRVPAMASAGRPVGGGGNTYNISVSVAAGGNPAEVGAATVQAIQEFERRSGKGWRS